MFLFTCRSLAVIHQLNKMCSPIRCRGPWKIHKRASEPDRWLDEMGYFRKHTARDSSCLFRAVSENMFNTQRYFHKVRLDCVNFMASKRHLFEGVGELLLLFYFILFFRAANHFNLHFML